VWMQLAHLFMADAVWICFVLLAANVMDVRSAESSIPQQAHVKSNYVGSG